MGEVETLGRMRAVLVLSGENCRPDEITQRLAITPITGEIINDFTEKENGKKAEYPSWAWSTEPKEFIGTREPLKELAEQFLPKLSTIQEICKEMKLHTHIKVMVHILGGDRFDPGLSFDVPDILFANAISADMEIIMENWPDILED